MITVTAEQIAALSGLYWWVRANGSLYATDQQQPQAAEDTYLLRASQQWLAQWDGNWAAAAKQINHAITRQEQS